MPARQLFETVEQMINPAHTVVVVIDMQNDFCAPNGASARRGADISACWAIVPKLAGFLDAARGLGVQVVHVMTHHDDEHVSLPDLWRRRQQGYDVRWNCLPGTWGAAFVEPLTPRSGEPVFVKHRYSAMTSPAFADWLAERGVQTLVFTGVGTNVCVESTLREAYVRDYYCVMAEDLVAASNREMHDATLRAVRKMFGLVMGSDELLAIWSTARSPHGARSTV